MNYLSYPTYHIYNLLVILLSTLHMLCFFYLSQYLMNRCSSLFSSGACPGVWLVWQVQDAGLALEYGVWCNRCYILLRRHSPLSAMMKCQQPLSGGISCLLCHVWILSVWTCAQSLWAHLCLCPIVSKKPWSPPHLTPMTLTIFLSLFCINPQALSGGQWS